MIGVALDMLSRLITIPGSATDLSIPGTEYPSLPLSSEEEEEEIFDEERRWSSMNVILTPPPPSGSLIFCSRTMSIPVTK